MTEPRRQLIMVAACAVVVTLDLAVIALRQADFARLGLLVAMIIFAGLAYQLRAQVVGLRPRAVLIITAVCQLPGLLSPPVLSDDAYRYVWDGRVQLAGISPYLYAPRNPVLAWLRDPLLFPPGREFPMINRSWVHTIYPPIAELWFTLVAAVTPWRFGTFGVQLGAAALVVISCGLLARMLSSGEPLGGRALIYGACPATTLEAANGAHVDVLAAFLLILMGMAVLQHLMAIAGVMLGLAAGVKLVPLILLPVFLARRRRVAVATALGTFLAGYLPHLLVVGALVVGFLPGYLAEEGFDGRRRFALLIFLPESARLPVALAISLGLAVLAVVRSRKEPVLVTCCWLYGSAFLVATPAYPWYLLPLIVLVIMSGRLEWLVLWPAAYLGYADQSLPLLQTFGYAAACVLIVVVMIRRVRFPALSTAG